MSKNEYRRAFIMLRPLMTGYSGHARLERRVMTGSLYFIVTAPVDSLRAALVGQRGGEYYAADLGALRRDARGQLTLAKAFDPRAIDGRPLEAYQLLAVADPGDGCQVALTGNVDGAYPMDAAAVREAVCALYTRNDAPAADLPAPGELPPEPAPEPLPDPIPEPVPEPLPEPVPEPIPEPVPESEPMPEPALEPALEPTLEPGPALDEPPAQAVPEATAPTLSEPEPEHGRTRIYTRMRQRTAPPAEVIEVVEAPPQSPEPASPERAALCRLPLEDGFTYMRAPLPVACGPRACLMGAKVENGRIAALRWAIPGPYAATPPEGLETAVWISSLGPEDEGYWVMEAREKP